MRPENQHNKSIKYHGQFVWLMAFVLALLVAATVAVAGTCLYRYAHRSNCEISLYQGQVNAGEKMEQTYAMKKTPEAVIQSKATSYQGAQAKEQSEKSAFSVKDAEQVWKTETAIELFKVSYRNTDGTITVQSADGDKVIAPGTEGSYTFSLKNTSDAAADYKIWVEATLSSNMAEVPLETRMSGYSGWLLGSKDQWQAAKDLNGIATEETIAAGKTAEYTIDWQWPFERDDDAADTHLGDQSAEADQEMTYTVTIYTLTAAVPESGNTANKDKNQQSFWQAVKTGDTAPLILWMIVLLVSACILICLLILKKRKNDRNNG